MSNLLLKVNIWYISQGSEVKFDNCDLKQRTISHFRVAEVAEKVAEWGCSEEYTFLPSLTLPSLSWVLADV